MIQEQTFNIKQTLADNSAPVINITGLYKSFDRNTDILKGIHLSVKKGENLVVLGKSGSGKSVLIKCLVGLIVADRGELKVFDTDITKLNNRQLNALRVKIGFLFQNSALYDSMTVRENLAFPLKRHSKKLKDKEVEELIKVALESVGLVEAIDKMPSELSGGMRKRIGLARTLILGLFVFAIVYSFMGFALLTWQFIVLFGLYALYAASTEGVSKALISNIAEKDKTATAIGFYTSFASIFTMLASSLAGLIWYTLGMKTMFLISGAGVMAVVIYLVVVQRIVFQGKRG